MANRRASIDGLYDTVTGNLVGVVENAIAGRPVVALPGYSIPFANPVRRARVNGIFNIANGALLGFASNDVPGIPTFTVPNGVTAIRAAVDGMFDTGTGALAGVVASSVPYSPTVGLPTVWSPFPTNATSMFKAKLSNNGSGASFQTTNGPNTFMVQTPLECAFGRVRIWVGNSSASAVAGVQVTTLAWAAAGADNNIAANHLADTWTDAPAAITLAANTNAANQPTWTPTGWITLPSIARTDSGKTLPGFSVMVGYPAGTGNVTSTTGPGTGGNGWETDGPNVSNRFYRNRLITGNFASNATKAGMTATATQNTFWPAIIIEYEPQAGISSRTLMVNYDSFGSAPSSGINLVNHYGWPERLQAQYSNASAPLEIVNAAFAGALTSTILATATSIATAVTKVVAIAPNGSGNDSGNTLTGANVTAWQTWVTNYRAMQIAAGNVPAIGTMSPVDPVKAGGARAYGATDSFRTAMNAASVALNSHSYLVADISTACSGAPDGSGQIILQNTDDGFHENDTGQQTLVPPVATMLALA